MSEVELVSVPAEALSFVLNYNWGDEYDDFLQSPSEDHIFMSLLEVSMSFPGWNDKVTLNALRRDLEDLEDMDVNEERAAARALRLLGEIDKMEGD